MESAIGDDMGMKRATYLAVGEKKASRKGDKRAKNGQKKRNKIWSDWLERIGREVKTHLI